MTLLFLSNSSTRVFGVDVMSITGEEKALPATSVLITGFITGISVVAWTGIETELFGCKALSVALAVTLPSGITRSGVIITWPLLSVVPAPKIRPFLSINATCVFGSVETSIGVNVPAL